MKVRIQLLILVLIAALSFLVGSWVTFQGTRPAAAPERKILHYVDPMNPALKFDSPGIAPCGMPREPVYADQLDPAAGGAGLRTSLPPGTIRISPEKQQLIGVKTMTVEKAPWTHTLRALGRVAPDETLVYQINAATEGWIEKAQPVTTGSQVKENELLATLSFFSLEYRTLVQNYFNLVNLGDVADDGLSPLVNNPQYSEPQLRQMRRAARFAGPIADSSQIDYYRKSLYNYGISPYQLKEMERTQTFPEVVEIRAPAAGFVLFRNVSPGLRLERGAEIFRIADLSRVWVLADIFENEASAFKPGMQVKMVLPYQKKSFYGRVSPVLPQFDPATRTLKMRLIVNNPGFVLRPDMFVDLEIPMSGPAAIVVPVDAVLDSGLKKTIFVAREGGYFEPRPVETGRHLGERVEIVQGLMAGEKVVVSGKFLIDSEARILQAASGILGKIGRDPVCGMNLDEDRAKAEGRLLEYKGKTYYFCESQCLEDFRKEPERYLTASQTGMTPTAAAPEAPLMHEGMAAMPQAPPAKVPEAAAAKEAKAMPAMKAPAGMPAGSEAPSALKPESGAGKIASPAPGTPAPRINLRMQRYGSPESAPIRRQEIGRRALPAPADAPLSQTAPNSGSGEMPMPGLADEAAKSGPEDGAALSGTMPGEVTPAPETPALRLNPQRQRPDWSGPAPIRRPKTKGPALADRPQGAPAAGFQAPAPLPQTEPGATPATPLEAPK